MYMTKIAFVFPGQGSQTVGMLQGLAAKYPMIQQVFSEASAALDYDLWELVQTDPTGKINQTEFTQPAVLTAGVAVWRLWTELNVVRPIVLAGHSLGEYTALVCAGALSLPVAVRLVAQRGRLMQAAVPEGEGAMAAILGLTAPEVVTICRQITNGVVQAVNFNAPGQIVIAGQKAAVEQAITAAKAAGAKRAMLLPLSVPSHCSLMRPAADKLALDLAQVTWQPAVYPVLHNFDVSTHSASEELINALVQQLFNPVRWIETIEKIKQSGVKLIIECGPGKVLTGLNKRIAADVQCMAIGEPDGLDAALNLKEVTTHVET